MIKVYYVYVLNIYNRICYFFFFDFNICVLIIFYSNSLQVYIVNMEMGCYRCLVVY